MSEELKKEFEELKQELWVDVLEDYYFLVEMTPKAKDQTKNMEDCRNQLDKIVHWIMLKFAKQQEEISQRITEQYKQNPPYTGRPFIHTTWDCFTLLKDYFSGEFGVSMPPVSYYDEWWKKGDDFYMELSGVAGFYPVTKLEKYDVIAMRLNSYVFNHSAIYLGDNKILHHVGGKFSCIETLRPAYLKSIFGYFRHKDIPQNG
jgi:hypothetical protein